MNDGLRMEKFSFCCVGREEFETEFYSIMNIFNIYINRHTMTTQSDLGSNANS